AAEIVGQNAGLNSPLSGSSPAKAADPATTAIRRLMRGVPIRARASMNAPRKRGMTRKAETLTSERRPAGAERRRTVSTRSVIAVLALVVVPIEVEQVEQIADGRHVARHIGIVVVLLRVGKVVAAARGQLGVELPVALHELHERGMLVVDVADVAAARERR